MEVNVLQKTHRDLRAMLEDYCRLNMPELVLISSGNLSYVFWFINAPGQALERRCRALPPFPQFASRIAHLHNYL